MGIFLLWATWAHDYKAIFVKIDGHHTSGRFKELEVCDFGKTWSACQRDDGSCCEKVSEFLVVTFSYNLTKR